MNPEPMVKAARLALLKGEPDVGALYELAKRHQWNAADLEWSALDFSRVPSELRAGLSDLIAQVHYGELGALAASARLVSQSSNQMDRLFGATQTVDEARHVELFSRLLFRLGAPGQVQPALAAFIDRVTHCDDPLHLLVGMNILIEGLSQTVLTSTGRLLRSLKGEHLGALRLVGEWVTERLVVDESRHLAFGIVRVRQLVRTLDASQRVGLEAQISQWACELMSLTAAHCAGVAAFGLDGDELAARGLADTQNRLIRAGVFQPSAEEAQPCLPLSA